MAFEPITILSGTGVTNPEYGLASGLGNTSQQIGGALGLGVLSAIATTVAAPPPINEALTLGSHTAFLAARGFELLAIVAAASIGTRPVTRRETLAPAQLPNNPTPAGIDRPPSSPR